MPHTRHHWNASRARAWHLFMPPARPSLDEVALYERLLVEHDAVANARWVLLGCTPELRSLAARHRRDLLCIDKNPHVFDVLRSMVSPRFSERFLCAEWLKATIPAAADVVLGDGSLNMLPGSKHAAFLRRVANMLAPGGMAILRVHLFEPPRFTSSAEVFAWYRAVAAPEPVFSATRTHLDMLWASRRTRRVHFPDYHRKVQQLYSANVITLPEFEAYNRLLRFNKISLYYTTRDRFEAMAARWFTICGTHGAHDYTGAAQHPLYFLRKRQSPPNGHARP